MTLCLPRHLENRSQIPPDFSLSHIGSRGRRPFTKPPKTSNNLSLAPILASTTATPTAKSAHLALVPTNLPILIPPPSIT